MATTAQDITNDFPVPAYRYTVDLGGDQYRFQDVNVGDYGVQNITYYDGSGIIRMPGRQVDEISVTMSRGVVRQASQLYDWLKSVNLNVVEKKDLTISLTDDAGENPIVTWKVFNCFPTTISVPDFSGSSNEISIETINIIADQVTVDF